MDHGISKSQKKPLETHMGEYGNQTLTSSIKTRQILKHNFGMPHIPNKKFVPVGKFQAKDQIHRSTIHDTEVPTDGAEAERQGHPGPSKFEAGIKAQSPRARNASEEQSKIVQGLSDTGFASRLEEMDKVSRMTMSKMNYRNDYVSAQKNKSSIYDYQKIQSTLHGSQFLGQRHYLFGGPTSGAQDKKIQSIHKESKFLRSSPTPGDTFDVTRGASVPLNSYNNITQFMPHKAENPRLTVLQNFKEINRIMTSTFIKNK